MKMKRNIEKNDAVKAFGKTVVREYKESTNKGLLFGGVGVYVLSKIPFIPFKDTWVSTETAKIGCKIATPLAEAFGGSAPWQCMFVGPIDFLLPVIAVGLIGYYLYINLWLNK